MRYAVTLLVILLQSHTLMISAFRPHLLRPQLLTTAATTLQIPTTRLLSSRTPAEQAEIDAARALRKAEKEAHKVAKSAKSAAEVAEETWSLLPPFSPSNPPAGDYDLITSTTRPQKPYTPLNELPITEGGQQATFRARVHSVRTKGGSSFLKMRDGLDTIQVSDDERERVRQCVARAMYCTP